MMKTVRYGMALAAMLALGACSKHNDKQAAPVDAQGNASGDAVGTDNAAGAADANDSAEANTLNVNSADTGNAAAGGGNAGD